MAERPCEFASDPNALEAVRHVLTNLVGRDWGATPWSGDTLAVFVVGGLGEGEEDYWEQCVLARQAQAVTRTRLAELGYEACGHAMVPDGNYGVAWVLLIGCPDNVTASVLEDLGQVAREAWRTFCRE